MEKTMPTRAAKKEGFARSVRNRWTKKRRSGVPAARLDRVRSDATDEHVVARILSSPKLFRQTACAVMQCVIFSLAARATYSLGARAHVGEGVSITLLLLLRLEAGFRREANEGFLPFLFVAGECSAPPPHPNTLFSLVESGTPPSFPFFAVSRDPPPHHDATALTIPPPFFAAFLGGGVSDTIYFCARNPKASVKSAKGGRVLRQTREVGGPGTGTWHNIKPSVGWLLPMLRVCVPVRDRTLSAWPLEREAGTADE